MRRILRAAVFVFEMTTGMILWSIFYGFFMLPVAMFHLILSSLGTIYRYAKHPQLSLYQVFMVTSVEYWLCYEYGDRFDQPFYWEWFGLDDFGQEEYKHVKQILEGK